MAVRFDASGDVLVRTASLPNYNATYTLMGWFYIVSYADYPTFFGVEGPGDNQDQDWFGADIATGKLWCSAANLGLGGSPTLGSALSTGTWYHLAVVRASATDMTGYLNGVFDAIDTTDMGTARTSVARLSTGAFHTTAANRLDGRVANTKGWDAALTAAEIAQEMVTLRPQRLANLHLWSPNWAGSGERARDYSGNGRNWTETGTLTDEDAPPVSYGAPAPWSSAPPPAAIPPTTAARWSLRGRSYSWVRG